MKPIIVIAAIFTLGAAAQEPNVVKVRTNFLTTVMGKAVKGAPYSADEITESLQVLADGTRITNQNQVTVYRDGEGRVRRESPQQITIWDPVANVSYTLDPKSMTAVKSVMGRATYTVAGQQAQAGTVSFVVRDNAEVTQATALSLDKLKAELDASQRGAMVVNGTLANEQATIAMKEQLSVAMAGVSRVTSMTPARQEALGQRLMQGVTADGTRTTTIIEAGAIGNDRPIQMVSERWFSSELQTPVLTKHTDPRTGEDTFRLANVHRGEPGADLFLLPPGYQLVDTAAKFVPQLVKKEE